MNTWLDVNKLHAFLRTFNLSSWLLQVHVSVGMSWRIPEFVGSLSSGRFCRWLDWLTESWNAIPLKLVYLLHHSWVSLSSDKISAMLWIALGTSTPFLLSTAFLMRVEWQQSRRAHLMHLTRPFTAVTTPYPRLPPPRTYVVVGLYFISHIQDTCKI